MWQGEERLRDLLAIQVTIELNVAFCERHLVNCAPSDQLEKECTYVSLTALLLFSVIIGQLQVCQTMLGIKQACPNLVLDTNLHSHLSSAPIPCSFSL